MTQHYIGSKQVVAWPETRDGKAGYAVKYPDGYTSWSPQSTFDAAYLQQGHDGSRVTEQMVNAFIVGHESTRLGNHTVVLVRLRNGFTLIEESACVDPANYDQAVGEKYALEKAKKHVWNHLGFLLATARNGVDVSPQRAPTDNDIEAAARFDFGAALARLKTGTRIARAGWNGKGQFVYLVPAASYPVQTGAAKAHFGEGSLVPYNAYLALKGVDDTVSTWVPSVTDCLAEDWHVVE
ncbi:Gp49 family protein [Burkholderia vietnamiensis]|uniref:Gp49 family protein n=1 Tax=Burkholderia vietnamiensis TaxID=60552 RepID=UPI001ABA41FB|nr:Gp49 family protein [Burkholderia vietnamiensis]